MAIFMGYSFNNSNTGRKDVAKIPTEIQANEMLKQRVEVTTYIPLIDEPYMKTYSMTVSQLKDFIDGSCKTTAASIESGECIINVCNENMPEEWANRTE